MAGTTLEETTGMKKELIKKICYLALKALKLTGKPYHVEKTICSSETIISFQGSWSVNDWFARNPFGETKVDLQLFPSLRSIGNDEAALVNEAFLNKFKQILGGSALGNVVQKAVTNKKKIVFTGYSSGAPIAILATLWALDKYRNPNTSQIPLLCVTFGSPLVGDRIFSHAMRRDKWSDYFINFVARYDIVPRILLAPLSSIQQNLEPVLQFLNPQSQNFKNEFIGRSNETRNFYLTVMKNAATITSHAACNLMHSTNLLVEAIGNFIELSPYRPFGTYIFCTENGKLILMKNPDAVLQLFFYSSQLSNESEGQEVAYRSLQNHLNYKSELLKGSKVVYLDQPEKLPLSAKDSYGNNNSAFNDLGMSTRARLCLRAAGELEMQKTRNQDKIGKRINDVEKALSDLKDYKEVCEGKKVGYYDAFKLQNDEKDFLSNVKRLELAGIWDEIIEMLKRYELPDELEGREEWIKLGTKFRRLVEPLDIANYYRHLKNEDSGAYMKKARPKRYRYTQRWLEHAVRMPTGACSESTFWAEVEELSIKTNNKRPFEDVKKDVVQLEKKLEKWIHDEVLSKDIFVKGSTFVKWWKTLPPQHQSGSCIKNFIEE
ncbi:Enhanced disease susceptibility 1 [Quillaja saponaria]|uniref:Enhanced disease susceptibility 1 n=1 Tax=Quillaja saponaria TaxID=32244 RepID=A0AAD7LDV6_QUISA|nr:Enhanced disease susceptibility 1 [Quillaja saponaria]